MLGESADDSDCDSCVPPYVRNGIDDGERIGGVLSLLGAALFFLFFLLAILAAIAFLVSRIFPEVAGSGRVHGLKCEFKLCFMPDISDLDLLYTYLLLTSKNSSRSIRLPEAIRCSDAMRYRHLDSHSYRANSM